MSLFTELKRRNVFRVSMAYLAGAWLILQVADTVIPWLGLDDSVGRILLAVMVVGFLPAVIAAWLFEWTPEGIRFDDEVEVDAAGAIIARRRLDRIIIGILALAVVYFAVDKFLIEGGQVDTHAGDRSVAVLPFDDISPDGDQAYFGNGIADELRLELQHLDGLRVAGRTSSNAYAQEDTKAIGEILNVESVLDGSVRKEGDNVRITVQLTDVADGFTIWSKSYDRKLEKIFEMQEEIAASVAGSLGVTLGVGGVNAFHGAGTRNVEAYEAYLQARSKDFTADGVREATALLERALELDPDYAAAWSRLSLRLASEMFSVNLNEAQAILERAHELALRSVQLDPESADAQWALAAFKMMQFDWIGSEQGHARAMELLPDRAMATVYGIMLMRAGRMTYAKQQFDTAEVLEPLDGRPANMSWHVSVAQGRIAEAKQRRYWNPTADLLQDKVDIAVNEDDPEQLKAVIREIPKTETSYIGLYRPLLAEFDSPEQVLPILQDVYLDASLQWPRKLHDIAMVAAYFGYPEFALKVKGEEVRVSPVRLGAIWYPVMSEVRRLPEFKVLVNDLNLVEYWRSYGWADACRPLGDDDFECS